ncbi:MAG: hypothetical protein RI935_717 [Candidatus Parcubacteria bacterium]|jgi:hypothetical protein
MGDRLCMNCIVSDNNNMKTKDMNIQFSLYNVPVEHMTIRLMNMMNNILVQKMLKQYPKKAIQELFF